MGFGEVDTGRLAPGCRPANWAPRRHGTQRGRNARRRHAAPRRRAQTNYLGAVRVTNALLPLLRGAARARGYARVLFTASPAGYLVTGSDPGHSDWAYTASYKALVAYANALRQDLAMDGVAATALYPAPTATDLAAPGRPILLQRAGGDAALAAFLAATRARLAAGQDPDFVAAAYVQALTMGRPPPNAAVGEGSSGSAFAAHLLADIQDSPYRFGCYGPHQSAAPFDASAPIARLAVAVQSHILQ